jgi:hypothetical protein
MCMLHARTIPWKIVAPPRAHRTAGINLAVTSPHIFTGFLVGKLL